MNKLTFSWPDGKSGAVTTSWDDGTVHDRRLLDIFNRHGIKGTWNLNAGNLPSDAADPLAAKRVTKAELRSLYAGHEIACHSFTHPFLERIPEEAVLAEMISDRLALEPLAGYPVKGMALPFGAYDTRVVKLLRNCGIVHCRTTRSTSAFALPDDFLEWHPTCHHKADLAALWKQFQDHRHGNKLLYVWGHSYEFDRDGNWDHIERFAALAGPDKAVWHATNMEICTYVTAWRSLWCSLDMSSVRNTSAVPLWFRTGDALLHCAPGQTLSLA